MPRLLASLLIAAKLAAVACYAGAPLDSVQVAAGTASPAIAVAEPLIGGYRRRERDSTA